MPIHYLKATCIENGEFRLTPWKKNAFNSKTKALTLTTRLELKYFFNIKEQKPTLASSKAIEALPTKPPYPYQIGLNKPPYLWRTNEQPIDFELQELFHLRLATHTPSRTLNLIRSTTSNGDPIGGGSCLWTQAALCNTPVRDLILGWAILGSNQ